MHAAPAGDGQPTLWADAHNHLHDIRLAESTQDAPIGIVNATREDEWHDVLTAARITGSHAAIGIHPWFANTPLPGWDERLRFLLEKHPTASVGECGLDAKSHSCPLESQIDVFERQLRLARELARPISIHCIGAWNQLMESMKRQQPPARWLMHSFIGSPEIARQLANLGAYFSISGRALHPNGKKILNTFRQIPSSRILLESDAQNHPSNLAAIGTAIAPLLGYSPEAFANLTSQNFRTFLGLGD